MLKNYVSLAKNLYGLDFGNMQLTIIQNKQGLVEPFAEFLKRNIRLKKELEK